MIVVIDTDATRVDVTEADNLRQLKALVRGRGSVEAALADLGRREGGQHLWIDIAGLRARAAPAGDADWPARYDAMIDYARGKGWVSGDGRSVRVHID